MSLLSVVFTHPELYYPPTHPTFFLLSAAVKADVQSSLHNVFLPSSCLQAFSCRQQPFPVGTSCLFFLCPHFGYKNREIFLRQIQPIFCSFFNLLNYINLFVLGKKDCGPLVYDAFGPINSMKRKCLGFLWDRTLPVVMVQILVFGAPLIFIFEQISILGS